MKFKDLYKDKKISAEEAAAKVKSGDVVILNAAGAHPDRLASAIVDHAKSNNLRNVTIHSHMAFEPGGIFDEDFVKKHDFNLVAWFVGTAQRKGVQQGWIHYMVGHFHETPTLMRTLKPNIFISDVSPLNDEGFFTFGATVAYGRAAVESADLVILQVNEHQPSVYGEAQVHISEVDYLVDHNHSLQNLPDAILSQEDIKIGQYVADLIEDGSTLQIGIGGMPSAVAMNLTHKKDLGIHTEMLADCMVDLYEAGVITGNRKTLHPGKIVGTFTLGSKKIYDFINQNPVVECYPVNYTNDPAIIAKNGKQIAINTIIEIDLTGQVCSESLGPLMYSGTGGQLNFTQGAYNSVGGKAFLCLHSTTKTGMVSKIVPHLNKGAVVTTPRTDVHYIVTEYGVAMLKGKTMAQRAKELIALAAPEFRKELTTEARKLHLI